MNYDEKIIKTFKKIDGMGKKQFTADAIAVSSGIPVTLVNKKLDKMVKYGRVKPVGKRKVNIWELV